MVPAILTDEKVVTGPNHGDAFGKLTEKEKNGSLISGFLDCKNNKFITEEDKIIYLKEILILRHGDSPNEQENGPLTNLGRIQALTVSQFLINMQIKEFVGFHSPYQRCKETSQIIEQQCHIPFSPCPTLSKKVIQENEKDFLNRLIKTLDFIPEKSILITHTDFIQNVIKITDCMPNVKINNCSITYIRKNKIIWLAKEV